MPSIRRSAAVLLASLVVLAGCAGIVDTDPVPGDRPVTTTETETPQTRQLAPGVTTNGVTDAWRLAQAHRDELMAQNRSIRTIRKVVAENGTVLAKAVATTRAASRTRPIQFRTRSWGSVESVAITSVNATYWSDGTEAVSRSAASGDAPSYDYYPDGLPEPVSRDGTEWERVYMLLAGQNTTVVETVNDSGVTTYVLRAQRAPVEVRENVSNSSVTVSVSGDGVVHEYHVTYERRTPTGTVFVEEHMLVRSRGDLTVARPTWYESAVSESS